MSKTIATIVLIYMAVAADLTVAAGFYGKNGVSFSAGLEYQYIAQEYYEAIIDTSSLDYLENWQFARDGLNDFIIRSNLGYRAGTNGEDLQVNGNFEFSGDRFLGRAEGDYRSGSGTNYFRIYGKYENKSPFENKDSGEGYHYFQGYLKGSHEISDNISMSLKSAYETVHFGRPPDTVVTAASDLSSAADFRVYYNYDYSIFNARLGLDYEISELDKQLLTWLWISHRDVPDSNAADYMHYRLESEYSRYGGGGYFTAGGSLEFKDYNRGVGIDDYTALLLRTRFSREVRLKYVISGIVGADGYFYSREDQINRNYQLLRAELKGGYKIGDIETGPITKLEYRAENEFDGFSEQYGQGALGIFGDYLGPGFMFFNAELLYGRRGYTKGDLILSSYNYFETTLILNYVLLKNLSVNLLFDGSFESHERSEDDTNIYLLTIGVSSHF